MANSRRPMAVGLVALGVILAAIAVWWGAWGWPTRDDAKPAAVAEERADDEIPPRPELSKPAGERAHSSDFLPAGVWAGLLAALCFGGAVWLLTQPVPVGNEDGAVRTEVLTFGCTVGFLTAILGLLLGFRWQDSLFKWVNQSKAAEAKWVLYAACVFTAGLIAMFASLQLARAVERANVTLRRLLYGFNAVFLGMLLLMVLVAINVVSFIKVPSTLLTTDAAFTELSEPSKTFLRSLDRPVHVYLMLPEKYSEPVRTQSGTLAYQRLYTDCRGFLGQCEDQSSHFKATYLSPGLDTARIGALLDKYKVKVDERDKEPYGMLVVVDDSNEAVSFISSSDLVETVMISRNNEAIVFQGENKLMTELTYLIDARAKEVVYFTQDNGELSVESTGDPSRSAAAAVQYLKDKKMRVEALHIDSGTPNIPDDAALVVVAGPRQTIAEDSPTMKAIRSYMRPAEASRRPGKLLAYLPAFPGPDGKVGATGLEPLLEGFGVQVARDRRLVGVPSQFKFDSSRSVPPDTAVGYVNNGLRLPIGGTLSVYPLTYKNARAIRAIPAPPGGQFAIHLVTGTPSGARFWQEPDWSTSAAETAERMEGDKSGQLKSDKQFGRASVALAVAVTESAPGGDPSKPGPSKPRLLVFGSDSLLQDRADPVSQEPFRQLVFSDCVDWLREREASLGIPPKKTPTYTIGKAPEWLSLFTLLGMMVIGIGGLGVGVWLSRRR